MHDSSTATVFRTVFLVVSSECIMDFMVHGEQWTKREKHPGKIHKEHSESVWAATLQTAYFTPYA